MIHETLPLPSRAAAARPYARTPAALPQCSYFVFRPEGDLDGSRLLVAVHGITRNAIEHVLVFRHWAERLRVPLVAPLFPTDGYHRYQTLAGGRGLPPADAAFDLILDDACRHLGLHAPKLHLFGHSGGAQFAHRYALRHPDAVARLVLGAAGWYTFPDPAVAYPRGLGAADAGPAFAADDIVARYPPTLVVVGDADRARDDALNRDPEIDRQQGRHRVARARRWVAAMTQAARAQGCEPPCRLHTLPDVGHAFGTAVKAGGLDRVAIEFLFPEVGAHDDVASSAADHAPVPSTVPSPGVSP